MALHDRSDRYDGGVSAITEGSIRWSVMIPAFNPGEALHATLASALAATAGRSDIEVVVVDDASTEPWSIRDSAQQVQIVRCDENLGAIGNFNRAISLATGEFVHLLHADDLVHTGFYESMERGFEDHGAGFGACRVERIDGDGARIELNRAEQDHAGLWSDALEVLAISNRTPAPSIAVRRSVYDQLGVFDASLSHAADWDMWLRIAAAEPVYYDPAVLVSYRVHDGQHTATVTATGDNIRQAIEVIDRLPRRISDTEQARSLQSKAFAYRGIYAARSAIDVASKRQYRMAAQQISMTGLCLVRAARMALLGR